MEIHVIKTEMGMFAPSSAYDLEKADKYKVGDLLSVIINKKRNPRFHRKFFALLNLVFVNLPEDFRMITPSGDKIKIRNVDHLLRIVKYAIGYYDIEMNFDGSVHYELKSISFDKMDDVAFSEFYSRVMDFLVIDLLCGDNEVVKELSQEVARQC